MADFDYAYQYIADTQPEQGRYNKDYARVCIMRHCLNEGYYMSGYYQKAIDMYTKVLEVDKDIAEAYFNRGLLYIYQGNRSAANVDLSKAGELGLTDSYSIIKRYCSVEEE